MDGSGLTNVFCFFFFLEREKFKLRRQHFFYISRTRVVVEAIEIITQRETSRLFQSLAQLLSVFSASVRNNLNMKQSHT